MIKSWSHSRLVVAEQCPYRAKLAYIDRIPEPERPLPPGKSEHANDRGTRIHSACEQFIMDTGPLPKEAHHFDEEMHHAQQLYKQGRVTLEGEWGFDQEWTPSDWSAKNTWLRLKIDLRVQLSPTHMAVIDWKTGQRYGNEFKHAEQMQMYQLATFMRYPELEEIDIELWYLDQNELIAMHYTRRQGLRFFEGYNNRGNKITSMTEFPPRPNIFTCKWCPYSPRGTGHCTKGV